MEYGHVVLAAQMINNDSKVIKFITRSYFSHAFITAPPILDRLMCLEAVANGVSMLPFDMGYENDKTEDYIMYSVNIPVEIKNIAINSAMNRLQKGYGFLELPWFAWRWLCGVFGKDIKKQNNWSQAGTICAELTADYLRDCGLERLFTDFGKGSINAQDIYNICKQHPEHFIEIKRKIRNPEDSRL